MAGQTKPVDISHKVQGVPITEGDKVDVVVLSRKRTEDKISALDKIPGG